MPRQWRQIQRRREQRRQEAQQQRQAQEHHLQPVEAPRVPKQLSFRARAVKYLWSPSTATTASTQMVAPVTVNPEWLTSRVKKSSPLLEASAHTSTTPNPLLSSLHSASMLHSSLRWLLAVLAMQRAVSWDLVISGTLWQYRRIR